MIILLDILNQQPLVSGGDPPVSVISPHLEEAQVCSPAEPACFGLLPSGGSASFRTSGSGGYKEQIISIKKGLLYSTLSLMRDVSCWVRMTDCVPCSAVSDQHQRVLSGINLATATSVLPWDPQCCVRSVGGMFCLPLCESLSLSLSPSEPGDGTFRKQHVLEVHFPLHKRGSFA